MLWTTSKDSTGRPCSPSSISTREEPRYAFYDSEAAARHWRLQDMKQIEPKVSTLHFGSLSLIRLPAANAFAELMRREAGRRIISFDPNIRAGLVDDEAGYRSRLEAFFAHSHVIKLSGADLDWIAPNENIEKLAAKWLAQEARIVLFTRGSAGATIFARNAEVTRTARKVKVADTVGAGDSRNGRAARRAWRPEGARPRGARPAVGVCSLPRFWISRSPSPR